ncbi:MAG: methyltransferase domain-containing protein [Clostridia bacterium]|nr:methyltransferase domain-containing protein [Oscillospiraceae bacterium]MBQ1955175.1 methyltransferase domain-containing protein [Clostridia bacterium]
MTNILRCPVCGEKLSQNSNTLLCPARHSFDLAKEGYVNLLGGSRPGSDRGDSREMALSRKAFLSKGYYSPLADAVGNVLSENVPCGNVLDICCGEGYYTESLANKLPQFRFYGFDISREMVRLAAKRKSGAKFFVANLASIPVADNSINAAVHLFAPFNAEEFCRILAPDGILLSVIPGKDHLMGLKKVLYDVPYPNDEEEPQTGDLVVTERVRVKSEIELNSPEDIFALFQMTPYYFKTGIAAAEKLKALESLKTEIEFIVLVCKKA